MMMMIMMRVCALVRERERERERCRFSGILMVLYGVADTAMALQYPCSRCRIRCDKLSHLSCLSTTEVTRLSLLLWARHH